MVDILLGTGTKHWGAYSPDELHFLENNPAFWRMTLRSQAWRPPTDVFETDDAIVVRVEIAGMREEDFTIQLDGRSLSIRGIRSDFPDRKAFHQMEVRFGEFAIEVELPYPVVATEVVAEYSQGFLRVLLPKAQPRRISIEEQDS